MPFAENQFVQIKRVDSYNEILLDGQLKSN